MSKNSHKSNYTQFMEWRRMMIQKGSIKINKKKKQPTRIYG